MANKKEEDGDNILAIPAESKKAQKQQTTEEDEKSAIRYFIREVKKMCDVMTCDEKLQRYKRKLERKVKENHGLQQELEKAKQQTNEALNESLALDEERKEARRQLEIAKKGSGEAHKLLNRKTSELAALKESLSRVEEELVGAKKNNQNMFATVKELKRSLSQSKEKQNTET